MIRNLSEQIKGSLYVILSAFMYATLPILAKFAYMAGLEPYSILLFRFMLTFIILSLYLGFVKKIPLLSLSPLVIIQGIILVSEALLFFCSLRYLSAGVAIVIFFSHPILVAVIALPLFREKISLHIILGLFLAITGVSLISGLSSGSINIPPRGLLLVVLCSICYAIYSIIAQMNVAMISPLTLTNTFAFISILILSVFFHNFSFIHSLTFKQFGIALSMALFNTVLAIVFFLKGIQKIGASRATLISTLEPVFTLFLAFLLLGEVFSSLELLGASLVLISMFLAVSSNSREIEDI